MLALLVTSTSVVGVVTGVSAFHTLLGLIFLFADGFIFWDAPCVLEFCPVRVEIDSREPRFVLSIMDREEEVSDAGSRAVFGPSADITFDVTVICMQFLQV